MRGSSVLWAFVAVPFWLIGCGDNNNSTPAPVNNQGGKTNSSSGGQTAKGGATQSGGTTASGGAQPQGGSATGGLGSGGLSSGGSTASGGASGGSSAGAAGSVTGGSAGAGGATGGAGGKASGGAGGGVTGGTAGAGGGVTGGAAGSGGTAGATGGAGGTAGSTGTGGRTVTDHPGACKPPTTYRNLFADILGKTDAEIDQKLEDSYKSLFHGGSDATIYYEVGSDQAYIKDINNNDVRSEGMSYGLMISVQMDKKAEFERLWNWTKKVMSPSGNGLFGWKASPPSTLTDTGSAPDGEEYIATSLIFAAKRWNNSNYLSEAQKTLGAMISAGLFDRNSKVVKFVASTGYSDPSYVLPAFYEVWACTDKTNQSFWQGAATAGRALFKKACNSQTGLAPYKSQYDGTPLSGADGIFRDDAWRVVGNIMMDHNLFAVDPWQTTFAKTYAAFWAKTQKQQPMPDQLNLNGTVIESHADPAKGLIAQNALVAFGVPDEDGKFFLQALWDMQPPKGNYRYYDGLLYMLATLHASGRFKLYY
ncbi:MAG TPA: glycosyl hydrolase family 8 [Polyangiaceae bacterium]|nr:glycosyl hydrolase family 8 [Polyangiaceae bacterium]